MNNCVVYLNVDYRYIHLSEFPMNKAKKNYHILHIIQVIPIVDSKEKSNLLTNDCVSMNSFQDLIFMFLDKNTQTLYIIILYIINTINFPDDFVRDY